MCTTLYNFNLNTKVWSFYFYLSFRVHGYASDDAGGQLLQVTVTETAVGSKKSGEWLNFEIGKAARLTRSIVEGVVTAIRWSLPL